MSSTVQPPPSARIRASTRPGPRWVRRLANPRSELTAIFAKNGIPASRYNSYHERSSTVMTVNLDQRIDLNMFGTTLRSWDPTIQAWRIAWTNPVVGHREDQIGRRSGKDIVQMGTRADGTQTRWTFTEITADSFHWLGEALQPDGMTWKLEGEFRAKRRTS